jgi:hypothetical protein
MRWPDSSGISGRFQPEYLAGLKRNWWPACSGIRRQSSNPSGGGQKNMPQTIGQNQYRKFSYGSTGNVTIIGDQILIERCCCFLMGCSLYIAIISG